MKNLNNNINIWVSFLWGCNPMHVYKGLVKTWYFTYIYIYHINIVCSMENDIGWVNENMSNVSIL